MSNIPCGAYDDWKTATPPYLEDADESPEYACACGGEAYPDSNTCQECGERMCAACTKVNDVCEACEPAFAERERRENAKTVFAALSQMSRLVAEGGAS